MSEKPILYQAPLSPPCRAVFLTGAALGIEFDLKSVDMMGGEHKSEDYIKVSSVFPSIRLNLNMNKLLRKKCSFLFELILFEKSIDTDRLWENFFAF